MAHDLLGPLILGMISCSVSIVLLVVAFAFNFFVGLEANCLISFRISYSNSSSVFCSLLENYTAVLKFTRCYKLSVETTSGPGALLWGKSFKTSRISLHSIALSNSATAGVSYNMVANFSVQAYNV